MALFQICIVQNEFGEIGNLSKFDFEIFRSKNFGWPQTIESQEQFSVNKLSWWYYFLY